MGFIGKNRVTENKVFEITEPVWTDTWHPVSHKRLLENLKAGVEKNNLRVTSREYSLNKTGTRLFGVWGLDDSIISGMKLAMGFRNSIDKTLPIGICAGVTVLVCENLALSGDFIKFRKHTSGLTDESLERLAVEAVTGIIEKMQGYRSWMNNLKDIPLIEGARNRFSLRDYPDVIDIEKKDFGILHTDAFKVLSYNLASEWKVFSVSAIPHFADALADEAVVAVDQNYPINSWYVVLNAVTRMNREESLPTIARTSARMEAVVKRIVG